VASSLIAKKKATLLQDLHVEVEATSDVFAAPLHPVGARAFKILEELEVHTTVASFARGIFHAKYSTVKCDACHIISPPRIHFPGLFNGNQVAADTNPL